MRTSQYPLFTLKETPADAEIVSHQLMLRAGLIRKLASGIYTWLPTGLRVLQKVKAIVREEMNRAGAVELSMPMVQPAELWRESARWDQYGPELTRLTDRHQRWFVLGPTHEEVITHLIRSEISSYKQLPLNLYQIQLKFRDEIRPRFGTMRGREFVMKDSYSFHTSQECLQATYDKMYAVYSRIFTRLGLHFRAVQADTGAIGGNYSHEFQVLAQSGEDQIAFSASSDYAANIELAEAVMPSKPCMEPKEQLKLIEHSANSVTDLSAALKIPLSQTVKTILVRGRNQHEHPWIALLVRGDHQLNHIKAARLPQIASPAIVATDAELEETLGVSSSGAVGPLDLGLPAIADRAVSVMSDFVVGANLNGQYYVGVNWQRDLPLPQVADLRNVVEGDPSPDGKGELRIKRGIEVGQIFQVGPKYSEALNATVQGKNGQINPILMGCYGIGISRIVSAAIEQHHDARGILWPPALAPFQVAILPLNSHKSPPLLAEAERIYTELQQAGIEVILDDRQARPGVMFADMELLGIPYMVIISEQNLSTGQVECKRRRDGEVIYLGSEQLSSFLLDEELLLKEVSG